MPRKLVTPFATKQVLRGLKLAMATTEHDIASGRLPVVAASPSDRADLDRARAWLDRAEVMRKEDRQ